MSKPEHVRCENCVYFMGIRPHPSLESVKEGFCHRYPPHTYDGPCKEFPEARSHSVSTRVHGNMFCGEFRAEWAE